MKYLFSVLFATLLLFSNFVIETSKPDKELFGTLADGTSVDIFTLRNDKGMEAKIMTYGASIVSLKVPDRSNKLEDVVLGYDELENYEKRNPMFGCIVGRYANRISKGKITINGKEYALSLNNGKNHIHGGINNFSKKVWKAELSKSKTSLKLTYLSKDMEEGYPGNLSITVTYTITDKNELKINYSAVTDKPTVINFTNHSYFNLAGQGSGDVLSHRLYVNADKFTPTTADKIPTGEIKNAANTALDFTTEKLIGLDINKIDSAFKPEPGYDHNFVLNKHNKKLSLAASVFEPQSGRAMEVFTSEPAVQFFTSYFFDGSYIGKQKKPYFKNYGFCLETQHFPDSPNNSNFPTTLLNPGEEYSSQTIYKFFTKN